jgi:hypothetical protein
MQTLKNAVLLLTLAFLAPGRHTEVAAQIAAPLPLAIALPLITSAPAVPGQTFAPGDLLVSLRTGEVQWWHADGTFSGVLANVIPGKAEGMGFDANGNLYVTHYCADASVCLAGNTIEKFSASGVSQGAFGGGYDCNPYSIVFDRSQRAYVGQADCTGDLLLRDPGGVLLARFDVASDTRGSARIDLAGDGCTVFYTSQGPNVKRFDVCSNRQLADFNRMPSPSGNTYGLRILPDGGVLVAMISVIGRLDASGNLVQTYDVADQPDLWLGLDLAGDGTFWASNYGSSDVFHFDLATGQVLGHFNTGTPTTMVKDVLVKH